MTSYKIGDGRIYALEYTVLGTGRKNFAVYPIVSLKQKVKTWTGRLVTNWQHMQDQYHYMKRLGMKPTILDPQGNTMLPTETIPKHK